MNSKTEGVRWGVIGCGQIAYDKVMPAFVESYLDVALVDPWSNRSVGMHAATKAEIKPGDLAVVMGTGPIGMVTALAARFGTRSRTPDVEHQVDDLNTQRRVSNERKSPPLVDA